MRTFVVCQRCYCWFKPCILCVCVLLQALQDFSETSAKSINKSMDMLCDCIYTVCLNKKEISAKPTERCKAMKLGLILPVSCFLKKIYIFSKLHPRHINHPTSTFSRKTVGLVITSVPYFWTKMRFSGQSRMRVVMVLACRLGKTIG